MNFTGASNEAHSMGRDRPNRLYVKIGTKNRKGEEMMCFRYDTHFLLFYLLSFFLINSALILIVSLLSKLYAIKIISSR